MSESKSLTSALPDSILAAYCPVLYLHHNDLYRPVSVEWFTERAQLNYYVECVRGTAELKDLHTVPGGVVTLISAGNVTQDSLLEAQEKCEKPGNLSLTVAPEHYAGWQPDALHQVPIYVHAKLVVDDAGLPEAYEINYITFYAFNGHYHIPAFYLPLIRTGHHVGDWEHLTVRLDAGTLELQGVWYNVHRNIEGEWCPAAQVPRTPCGRIIGYVALNGHGIYPHCGRISRLFFMANDRTSRRGPVWSPSRLLHLCGLPQGSSCAVVPSRGCSLPLAPGRASSIVTGAAALYPPRRVRSRRAGRRTETAAATTSTTKSAPRGDTTSASRSGGVGAEADADSYGVLQPAQGRSCCVCAAPHVGDGAAQTVAVGATAAAATPGPGTSGEPWGPHEEVADATAAAATAAAAAARAGVSPAGALQDTAQGGLLLPPQCAEAGATGGEGGQQGADGASGASPSSSSSAAADGEHNGEVFPLPEVVQDTSPWQRYRGRWGSVVHPAEQCWFVGAEPPVSRGFIKRLLLPCAPGVERLVRRRL